jgi:hypothetical protein
VKANGDVWAAVAVALINMIGSVAMAYIRGKFGSAENQIDKRP